MSEIKTVAGDSLPEMDVGFYIITAPSLAGPNVSFGKGGRCGLTVLEDKNKFSDPAKELNLRYVEWFASEEMANQTIADLQKSGQSGRSAQSRALRDQQLRYAFNLNQLEAVNMYIRIRPVVLSDAELTQIQLSNEVFGLSDADRVFLEENMAPLVDLPQVDLSVSADAGAIDSLTTRPILDASFVRVESRDVYRTMAAKGDEIVDEDFAAWLQAGWNLNWEYDAAGGMRACGAKGDECILAMRLFSGQFESTPLDEVTEMREAVAAHMIQTRLKKPIQSYALHRLQTLNKK